MVAPSRLAAMVVAIVSGSMVAGCKKTDELEPVDLGGAIESFDFEGAEGFAPEWSAPAVLEADAGFLIHWMHEPDSPVFNLRLVLPLDPNADPNTTSVLAAALDLELQNAFAGEYVTVRIHHAADRVEVEIHGLEIDAARILEALTAVVASRKPEDALADAQREVANALAESGGGRQALAFLTGRLLGRDPELPPAHRQGVTSLPNTALVKAHGELLDPRRAVLVVHTGRPVADYRDPLDAMSTAWKEARPLGGLRLVKGRQNAATERVRAELRLPKSSSAFLRAQPIAPLEVVPDTSGYGTNPVLFFGRVIPTPTAEDRAMARMAHRLIQEELDARLVISGPVSLFVVRVDLRRAAPHVNVHKVLDELDELASTQPKRERVETAAQLWLGARLVSASMRGEDWTRLWSDALDLSDRDEEIPVALAREAKLMLETDPAALLEWQQRWLRPSGGEPGWSWAVAGVDPNTAQTLKAALATPHN